MKYLKGYICRILILVLLLTSVTGVSAASKLKIIDQRVAGANRYETSFAVAESLGKGIGLFDSVVVASGRNFPDALSGGYLTKAKKAPLILETSSYDDYVVSRVEKLMRPGGTVYVLGGPNAVGSQLEEKLKSKDIKVSRLEGPNRYATNLAILKESFVKGSELLVASGKAYPDALSGSSVGIPMLLTGDGLGKDQIEWLKSAGIKKIYILGGSSAVNTSIEKALKEFAPVERVAGTNRYDTSRKIAGKFFPNAEAVTLISGLNFPDGLSGAPIAMQNNAPILLTSPDNYSYARSFVVEKKITKETTVGGTAAVSKETVQKIMEQYEGEPKHVHIWNTSFDWSSNRLSATAEFKCADCQATESEKASVTYKVTKEATDSASGKMTFTAKAKSPDGVNRTGTKTLTLPKLYHGLSWDWTKGRSGKKMITCKAYAYTAGGYGASGKPAIPGTVAVDRSVIPLGTKLYVEGYGFAVANDTGGNIIGNTIDVVLSSNYMCRQWGIKYVDVYILD